MARTSPSGADRPLARIPGTVWAGLATALVSWLIAGTPVWRSVEVGLFDELVVRTAPNKVSLPITIVGLDDNSFAELGAIGPMPRRHHARLLDNLREAGAALVGFDIGFAEATGADDDEPFAQAIRRFGRVVLASDYSFREDRQVREWFRVDPHPAFLAAGARQAQSALSLDADGVLRRVPAMGDAFWRVVLEEFGKTSLGGAPQAVAGNGARIRYFGGARTFPYVPYYMLLDPDRYLPSGWRELLRDNIVLVGRNPNVVGDVGAMAAEIYQTPFFKHTREFMPRVEVHANLVAGMVTSGALHEVAAAWRYMAWAAAVLASFLLTWHWHPLRSGAALAALLTLSVAAWVGLFVYEQVWLPAGGAMLAIVLMYLAQAGAAYAAEERQRSALRNAFSMYLSTALVDEIIAHAERLKLGGERRHVTILFSDLTDFTSIAERLEPEDVAQLVNRHHTVMTDAIMEHGGMVQKFLGDGILAYFGVPVADDRQSQHAVQAALEMQRRMARILAEVAGSGGQPMGMRIGVNRGQCVVGNMGSNRRFDYVAVGDPVNLASRLEGANKFYGTAILVSQTVVDCAGPALRFREIDTVRVKGKQSETTIYEPCTDESLIVASARALAAYRAGNLDVAEATLRRILQRHPADAVSSLFLGRIAALRQNGVPDGWSSIALLDSK